MVGRVKLTELTMNKTAVCLVAISTRSRNSIKLAKYNYLLSGIYDNIKCNEIKMSLCENHLLN